MYTNGNSAETLRDFQGNTMLAVLDQTDRPFAPTGKEAIIARAAAERLRSVAEAGQDIQISVEGKPNVIVPLPARAVELIFKLLDVMADEVPVSIIPHNSEMTTQQAADYLNVSRPHLIQQIEAGKMPFRKVGSHRRIKFADLLAYEADLAKVQAQAMKTLADEAERLGLD
jgi:excisionase family DNA binding protein